MIAHESDAFERGFLKFIRDERGVEISCYLANTISSEKHTIRDREV